MHRTSWQIIPHLLPLLAAGFLGMEVHAQCGFGGVLDNTNATPTACPGNAAATCVTGGEYVLVNVVAGNTYTFSTCGASFDTQITLFNNANGTVQGYNDDGCGLQSTITWTATFTGTVRVLVNQFNCATNSTCATLNVSCTGTGSPTGTCGSTVYDTGGAGGNYANNENYTVTYCPDVPGEAVTLTFSQFGTENCCDFLFLYNGNSTAAPLIGQYNGTNSPGTITSTSPDGCITLRFVSDGSITGVGWTAAISCGTPPPPPSWCNTTVYDPGGGSGDYGNSVTFTQTYCPDVPGEAVSLDFSQFSTEGCCDFLTIYNGNSTAAPVIGTYSGTNSPGLVTSTAANGCLTIRFTSDGSVTGIGWVAAVICGDPPPPPPVCNSVVYDPGGATGPYGNSSTVTYTYCPETPGEVVTLTFTEFATEQCCDFLTVHNGNSTASPVIGTYSGGNSPGSITSTAANGCITLSFTSDGSVTANGWAAVVTCSDQSSDCAYLLVLNDSGNNGWGSSSVGVSINGGPFTSYSVSGASNAVVIPANVGDILFLDYTASGPNQDQNSFSLQVLGQGTVFSSGSPPVGGLQTPVLLDCEPPPAPVEDCIGGITLCSNQAFNNNTNNTGNIADLTFASAGCLLSTERQGTWYNFSPSEGGTLAFTISPTDPTDDYDFAMWGPFPEGSNTGTVCPPLSTPLRCSYAAPSGNTGLSFTAGDLTEGAGGDRWVRHLDVQEGEVYLLYISNFSQSGLAFDLSFDPASTASLDCTVLPLELFDLEAEPGDAHVDLHWVQQSDRPTSHFVVQRSADGMRFEALGQLAAATVPHGFQAAYDFRDEAPMAGINHYRVLRYDTQGHGTKSAVVTARSGHHGRAWLAPNPAADHTTLHFSEVMPPGTRAFLLDASGRLVRSQHLPSEGTGVSLSLMGLDAGLYTVLLQAPEGGPIAYLRLLKE